MENQNNNQLNNLASSPVLTVEHPRQSNFLVILLSSLLVVSVLIAVFFAFQTQKLVKELTLLRTESTPMATVESTTEPVATGSSEVDPTVDWKTYSSKQWKFNIKYPSDWKVVSADKPIVYLLPPDSDTPNSGSVAVTLTYNDIKPKVPDWFKNNSVVAPGVYDDSSWAMKNDDTDEIIFWKNTVSVIGMPKYNSTVTKEVYMQILSTFKFSN